MEIIRALQRPFTIFCIIASIVGMGIYLGIKYGDAQLADDIWKFIIGGGLVLIGFLFRDRVKK